MMTAIDLFAGAGGLSIAIEEAGFELVFANEINPVFAKTHRYNFPNVPLLEKDVNDVTKDDVLANVKKGKVDLVAGGPPCQGFSIFGKRRFVNTRGYDPKLDPRNHLVYEYIRLVDELRPSFFFMENVKGFMNLDKGMFVEKVKETFRDLGYNSIWCDIVCAADYGVPQQRYRMFMIGNNLGIEYEPPMPTHFPLDSGNEPLYTTVGDAIMDLVDKDENDIENHIALNHRPIVAERMSYVPEGGKLDVDALPEKLKYATRKDSKTGKIRNYSHVYKRLARDKPSLTMVPGHNAFPIHPTLNRTLTPREAARIQSFPDSHVFYGTRQEQCIEVGNAVPPKMAVPFLERIYGYLNRE